VRAPLAVEKTLELEVCENKWLPSRKVKVAILIVHSHRTKLPETIGTEDKEHFPIF
jgi:hypothetical protein